MESIEKTVWSQDSYFKTEPKKSGETSINLSNELFDFLGRIDDGYVEFTLYKEDFLKAVGVITNVLPLFTSSSKDSTKCDYSNVLVDSYYTMVST